MMKIVLFSWLEIPRQKGTGQMEFVQHRVQGKTWTIWCKLYIDWGTIKFLEFHFQTIMHGVWIQHWWSWDDLQDEGTLQCQQTWQAIYTWGWRRFETVLQGKINFNHNLGKQILWLNLLVCTISIYINWIAVFSKN